MRNAIVLLFALLVLSGWTHGNGGGGGSAPSVTGSTFAAGEPAATNQAVGTASATNGPTSWSILSCSGCTNYFNIDNSGNLTVSATGSANITANNTDVVTTFSPVVQASNGSGSGSATVTVNFYADGSTNAPTGTAQHPSLLSGYTLRPPWKVAGVDYAVGYPSGTTLTDWQSISNPNVTVGGSSITITGNVTLNAIDFSLHSGAQVNVNSGVTSFTVTNSNFGGSSYGGIATSIIHSTQTSGSLTVQNCIIDGGSSATGSAQLIAPTGAIATTVQYNWFKNSPSEVVSLNGASSLTYDFNLAENNSTNTSDHLNILQWASVTSTAPLMVYNTMLQNQVLSVGEGFQLYGNNGGTITAPILAFNTMIAPSGTGTTVSYFMHGTTGTGTSGSVLSGTGHLHDNYFDITEAFGAFYSGSWTGYVFANQYNMVTGAAFSNTPP